MANNEASRDYSKNKELLQRAKSGDDSATSELVEANMGLVRSIALRFSDRGTELEDLMQIGTIGMIKAIRSYTEDYKTVFSTYAVPLIIGEIRRFLRDDGMIKVARGAKRLAMHAMKQKERFMQSEGREPRLSELALLCECSVEELTDALEAAMPPHSLSEPVGDDESMTLEGVIESKNDGIAELCDMLSLKEALGTLEEFEKHIIFLRYYRDLSQQQTADLLGVSQVKVSRSEKKIYEKLRARLTV